ncbi:MAG: HAMP domain-containing histidine kinase [Eubacterium sp.]|nr:HAMP domain-containing histidine kinase [Eubacterium sp.]
MRRIKSKYLIRMTVFLLILIGGIILGYNLCARQYYILETEKSMVDTFQDLSKLPLGSMGDGEIGKMEELASYGYTVDVFCEDHILFTSSRKRNLETRPDSIGILDIEDYEEEPVPIISENVIMLKGKVQKNGTTYFILLAMNIKSLDSSINRICNFLIIEMFLALIIAVPYSIIQANRTLKPIEQLEEITNKLKDGLIDFDKDKYKFSNDEVGVVAERIFEMYMSISDKLLETQNYNYLLRSQNDGLVEMDERKKDFIRMATHELKTPLAIVSSQLEMMNLEHPEAMEEYYESVMEEINKMSDMIRDLLQLSMNNGEKQKITLKKVNFSELLLSREKRYISWMNKKNLKAVFDIEPDVYVMMNQEQMMQAFNNLLMNAFEHAESESSVKVSLKMNGGNAALSVYNCGEPIPEKDFGEIWKSYFSKKQRDDNVNIGVGLYIVKEIVKEHNGICFAENRDKGVVFTMVFKGEKGKS